MAGVKTTLRLESLKAIIKKQLNSKVKIEIASSQSYHFLMSSVDEILGAINDSDITNFISTFTTGENNITSTSTSMKIITGENGNITASTSNNSNNVITDLSSFSLIELLISSDT
ncbi:13783_t:CDS:2 [Entrophospora sp. SA101]|nr:13783_t:CDS:2 [Entrophospora sp. SA101]